MTGMKVFTLLIMVVTILVGIPGNFLVIWVTSVKMKRTVNTIWYWNLAVADVIFCLSLPFSIAQDFYYEWLYGPAFCKILPVIVHLSMFASVFTLVAISIDRCILVVLPVWAQNHRTLRMAWMICLVVWMLAFLMCLPAALHRRTFIYYNITFCNYKFIEDMFSDTVHSNLSHYELSYTNHSSPNNGTEEYCSKMQPHPTQINITFTRMVFGFLIPLIVISASYLLLIFKVQNTSFLKFNRRTSKVIFGIVVAFFATWAPYHILGIAKLYFCGSFLNNLDALSVALTYFNSCINPVLYVFMGKHMKKTLRKSLFTFMENAFSDEVSRSTERSRSKVTIEEDSVMF